MKERLFRFKQFSVNHLRSAMKVGVDGVLIGAWASCRGSRLLDVGCGCGLISLMLAQRNPLASIFGIDIDSESLAEAEENVKMSPWSDRITIIGKSFADLCDNYGNEKFDIIVSNPPFFDSGITDPSTPREKSRHQSSLSPLSLITEGIKILAPEGRISFIAPADSSSFLMVKAYDNGLKLHRVCYVRNSFAGREKRVMIELGFNDAEENVFPEETELEPRALPTLTSDCLDHIKGNSLPSVKEEHLTLFNSPGNPTDTYRSLCGDFYLRF